MGLINAFGLLITYSEQIKLPFCVKCCIYLEMLGQMIALYVFGRTADENIRRTHTGQTFSDTDTSSVDALWCVMWYCDVLCCVVWCCDVLCAVL